MKRYILILLCAAIVLSFSACKIVKTGEDETNKDKTEVTTSNSENTNIPEAARGIHGALEKGLGTISAKFQEIGTAIPAEMTTPGPFGLTFDFEGDFSIPSAGSAYASLFENITLNGDIKSNGTDLDIGTKIGLGAAQGTLDIKAYIDDATGLYFTVPGYMSDTLNIPLEALGDLTGSGMSVDTSAMEQLDPAILTDLASAFTALIDEYADSIFTYIPDSAYSEQQVSYTPSESNTPLNVTRTVITLTPEYFNAVIKGIAGELSQDTVLFPAFLDALFNLIEAGSEMNGETFDRMSAEEQIYAGLNEMASQSDGTEYFNSFVINAYYTSDNFYELSLDIVDTDGEQMQISLCTNPETELCEIYLEMHPGTPGDTDFPNMYIKVGIGGEEIIPGLTRASFTLDVDDGYTQLNLDVIFDFSISASGNVLKGEIDFTGDGAEFQLLFDSSTTQNASGKSFDFNITSIELKMDGVEVFSGTIALSGTYRQLTSAEVVDMAPSFSNVVDISTIDENSMNNILLGLMNNPVVATIIQIMMTVEQ